MYRTLVIIEKIRAKRTPTQSRGVLRSMNYPANYAAICQNEKLHTVCLFTIYLLPFVVFISRVIVCQRR